MAGLSTGPAPRRRDTACHPAPDAALPICNGTGLWPRGSEFRASAFLGGALALSWRAPKVGLGCRFGMLSRETLLLANHLVLAVTTGAVTLGEDC